MNFIKPLSRPRHDYLSMRSERAPLVHALFASGCEPALVAIVCWRSPASSPDGIDVGSLNPTTSAVEVLFWVCVVVEHLTGLYFGLISIQRRWTW